MEGTLSFDRARSRDAREVDRQPANTLVPDVVCAPRVGFGRDRVPGEIRRLRVTRLLD